MQVLPRLICIFLLCLVFTLIRDDKVMWKGNSYDGYIVRLHIVPKTPVAEMLTFYNSAKVSSERPEPEVEQPSTQHKKFHHKPF